MGHISHIVCPYLAFLYLTNMTFMTYLTFFTNLSA
jgi:hypothetical protein